MASFFFGLQRLLRARAGRQVPSTSGFGRSADPPSPSVPRRSPARKVLPHLAWRLDDRTAARSTHFRPAGLCEPRPDPILNSKDEAATREPATGHGTGGATARGDADAAGQRTGRRHMRLDQDQLRQFDQQGFVFLPKVFSAAEVRALRREVPAILAQDRQEVVREKDGKTPRTAFAVHTYNDLFGRLARHPRLVEPVEQLLDGPCTFTSSRSTPRRHSTATSGSGTRTTAPGSATTRCPRRGR